MTIGKLAAYLEKSGADKWWMLWMKQARTHTMFKTTPQSGICIGLVYARVSYDSLPFPIFRTRVETNACYS